MNEELLTIIKQAVEETVDKKINGKLASIQDAQKNMAEHLKNQDTVLSRVEELLEDKDFLVKLWAFMKFVGGVAVSIGGGILLYMKLKQ